jgi:hypothetical protein
LVELAKGDEGREEQRELEALEGVEQVFSKSASLHDSEQ